MTTYDVVNIIFGTVLLTSVLQPSKFVISVHLDEHILYGHSRDYHLLDANIPSEEHWNQLVKRWLAEAQSCITRFRRETGEIPIPSVKSIQAYINSFKPAFTEATDVITTLVNHSAVLTGRLKSASSVHEKLERKNCELKDLTDIIGMRLTCQTVDESLRMKKLISEASNYFEVKETKCYGMCPGAGKYRSDGYRRIHLILVIKSDNKSMELQIGTPYTNMWADWGHDLIYKGPKEFAENKNVKSYASAMADYFVTLDEERNQLPQCPSIMEEANALDILKDNAGGADPNELYKKLGYPPNACFWWNDMELVSAGLPHSFDSATSLVLDLKFLLICLLAYFVQHSSA